MSESRQDALVMFAAWISRRETGNPVEFAELLRLHPESATELEELHATWKGLTEVGDASLAGRSVHADIVERFGEEADSKISLHGERKEESSSEFATARLSELAARTGNFGRYEVEGEVARGGMGAILRVWDEDLRRHLAMKVVLDGGEAAGKAAKGGTPSAQLRTIARFLEEAQVTGQLDHPGIVPVHELGLDNHGRVYFTMKLVEGRDLKQILALVFEGREGWNETRALGVMLKVCEAVAYAHKKGVIHRDLKPANVMVGSFGEVFVMDWGLARVLGRKDTHDLRLAPETRERGGSVRSDRREEVEAVSDSPLVTLEGDVVGTPAYMPPEQALGEVETLSPRSDVYSIGAMLYHLLARQMPYVSPGEKLANRAVLVRLLSGPPRPLHELNESVPAELAAICEKAMAREAEMRYPDTLALAEDLRAYLEHRVVSAYETGAVAELRKWVGRNKPLAAALAGAAAILVLGIVTSTTFATRANTKAKEANLARLETTARNRDLEAANTTIQEQIADLAAATKTAQEKERLAKQEANDVLSLSAIQELKELVEEARALWPAFPDKIAAYDAWIAKANVLIEGRAEDPARGTESHPSLADHEEKLAEIRLRAKTRSAERVEADRRASPHFAAWEKARAELLWMRRMLGQEPWPSESEAEAELATESLPLDARGLNGLAWSLVDPDPTKIAYGNEVKALVLARRAVATADEGDRAAFRDTLGWALYRSGQPEEAIAEEEHAVEESEGRQKERLSASLNQMRERVSSWKPAVSGPDAGRDSNQAEEAKKLVVRVAEIESRVNESRMYEFEDAHDRWWHTQLAQLVSDLKAFADEKTGLFSEGTSTQDGWGIAKRRQEAATIEERSLTGSDAKKRWEEAILAIATSPKYGERTLAPQMGLLPIGPDPESGLWEFAHLQTGEPAERSADGRLTVTESMGLVFVLIPGGKFWMGAQNRDPTGRNYDPQAREDESPVHEVELSPYFLSKYEMTQGQWQHFVGRNPSSYGPGQRFNGHVLDLRHPVENVSWSDCIEMLARLGLSLPSEAQWEYACRGRTSTPWWTGEERESLRGRVNVADQSFLRAGGLKTVADDWPDLDDGWAVHAPVGSFAPNSFGLHEVHGNVWEWCRDGYGNYGLPMRPGDGERQVSRSAGGVQHGGSFSDAASYARSTHRSHDNPENHSNNLGLRPARGIQNR